MDRKKIAIAVYILISVTAVVLLAIVLSRKKSSEGFRKCICTSDQGGRERDCQDTVTVNNLYVTGELTENSKLPDHPNWKNGWSTVSPGDIDFPISEGCNWTNASSPGKGWVSWDFTDFGS